MNNLPEKPDHVLQVNDRKQNRQDVEDEERLGRVLALLVEEVVRVPKCHEQLADKEGTGHVDHDD